MLSQVVCIEKVWQNVVLSDQVYEALQIVGRRISVFKN